MSEMLKDLKNTLINMASDCDIIFITGHKEPDLDCVASAIGLYCIATFLGKEAYIVIDESDMNLESGVKKIKDECKNKYPIINAEEMKKLRTSDSGLILTDVGAKSLINFSDEIDSFKHILIIDHHCQNSDAIPAEYKFIEPKASSACELITQVLLFLKVKLNSRVADYLLAGIYLDTKRFVKNTSSKTLDVARRLMSRGASSDRANELLLAKFEEDRKINDLVFNGTVFETYLNSPHQVSFTLNRENPTKIFSRVQLAKAADKMLKYDVSAAFTMGYTKEGEITLCARSKKDDIDVSKIMQQFGGGGNRQNAGGRIIGQDILEIDRKLHLAVSNCIETFGGDSSFVERTPIQYEKK